MHYLTVATCIKQEDPYIDDYVKINKALGVEHMILFDRDGENLTNRYKGRDDITVVRYPEPERHHHMFAKVIREFQGFSRWVAFIDCDQVLFPTQTNDLKVALQEFEPYAQLQCNWNTWGSGGLIEHGEGSIYERFTKRAKENHPLNAHTQGIGQISKCAAIIPPDPHRICVKQGEISVDENHKRVGDHTRTEALLLPPTQKKLFVAHYILKSRNEYLVKREKRRADNGEYMNDLFYEQDAYCNEEEDTRIKEFWLANCK